MDRSQGQEGPLDRLGYGSVRLVDFEGADQRLVERWLRADHVRRYWGEPEENARLLREPPTGTWRALIEADGRKVGLVLWQHPTRQELDEADENVIESVTLTYDFFELGAPGSRR